MAGRFHAEDYTPALNRSDIIAGMPKIKPLPPAEVEKITAGEVVERPASVVKELVENALDAGATRIRVEIGDGGKAFIVVADDGSGMGFDDLGASVLPHHTSKIETTDDLLTLTTLGFRGEALPSIGAVSRLRITSRSDDEPVGADIRVEGGSVTLHQRVQFNRGTTVRVEDIFYNVPVRKKFIRSRATETSLIAQTVVNYALVNPGVAFELISEGKRTFTTGDRGTLGVLSDMFTPEIAREMIPVDFRADKYLLGGFVAPPHHHRNSRAAQYFYVNKRPVRNKIFFRAVDDALRDHISAGKYPIVVLFIGVPTEQVDVNVHPSKTEVSFSAPQMLYSLISVGLRDTLSRSAGVRQADLKRRLLEAVPPVGQPYLITPGDEREPLDVDRTTPPSTVSLPIMEPDQPFVVAEAQVGPGEAARQKREEVKRKFETVHPEAPHEPQRPVLIPVEPASRPVEPPILQADARETVGTSAGVPRPSFTILGQVDETFIAFVKDGALFLIDQHSAHERILFDSIYAGFIDKLSPTFHKSPVQPLLFPILHSLRPDQVELLSERAGVFEAVGFGVEVLGDNVVVLKEVPAFLVNRVKPALFAKMVDDALGIDRNTAFEVLVKEVAARIACRSAIRSGDRLGEEEMVFLVKSLLELRDSYTCPHGRPTVVSIGSREIGRLFQR